MVAIIYAMFTIIYAMLKIIYAMFKIIYAIFNIIYVMFNIIYAMFNIIYAMFKIIHAMFNIICAKFNIICTKFNIIYAMFKIIYAMFNIIYTMIMIIHAIFTIIYIMFQIDQRNNWRTCQSGQAQGIGFSSARWGRTWTPSCSGGIPNLTMIMQTRTKWRVVMMIVRGGEFQVLQGFLGSAGGQDEPLKFLLRFFKSRPFLHLPLLPVSPSPSYNPIMLYFSELCWVFQTNKVYYTGPTYVVLHTNYSQTHILDFYDVLVL